VAILWRWKQRHILAAMDRGVGSEAGETSFPWRKFASGLGIGLPMKIATDDFLIGRIEHWSLLRPGHHAGVLGAIASERYSCKKNGPHVETGPPVRSPQ
jgi:hypothetical protein